MAGAEKTVRGFMVRAARVEDIDAIMALERATERAPRWAREIYMEILRGAGPDGDERNLRKRLMVAKGGEGQIVGFAAGHFYVVLPDSAVLESVCVAPAARRAGVGRALCEAVFEWCRGLGTTEMGLEVRAGNAAALALYAGLGFVEAGRRRGYYADPVEDAVLLRAYLTGSQAPGKV